MYQQNKNSCIYCNSKNIKTKKGFFAPFLVERMFLNNAPQTSIVICKDCGFSYSEYRPNDKEMERLYNGYRGKDYQEQRQKHEPEYTEEFNKNLGFDIEGQKFRKNRLADILKKSIDFNSINYVLDFGGDAGQFIPDEFQNSNKFVYEISNVETIDGVEQIRTKEELFKNKYDFIMCAHVLEHVAYPMDIIKEMYNLLNVGGYLYIELPIDYYESWDDEITYIHEHISRYNLKTLTSLRKILKEITILDVSENGSLLSILISKESPNFLQAYKIFYQILVINLSKFKMKIRKKIRKIQLLYECWCL